MRVRPEYIPTLQKHRATGDARVTLSGKDFYLGPYDDPQTHARYDELIRAWLANGRRLPQTGPATVRALGEKYLTFADLNYRKRGKPTSMVHIIRRAFALLEFAELADRAPADFTDVELREFYAYLGGHPKQRWTRRTINGYAGAIVQAFGWAAEHRVFEGATMAYAMLRTVKRLRKGRAINAITPAPRDNQRVRPVADDLYARSRSSLLPEVAAMVEIQRLTGMRPIEVTMMRAGDLRPTSSPSVLGYVVPPEANKLDHLDKPRVIAIGPDAREHLDPLLKGLKPTDYVFCPRRVVARFKRSPKGEAPGTHRTRGPGEHYTTNSYRRAIWRACDRAFPHPTLAGIARTKLTPAQRAELAAWKKAHRWNPNQLRHAFASTLGIEETLSVVQSAMGHASPNTTAGYVTVPAAEVVRVAAKRRKR